MNIYPDKATIKDIKYKQDTIKALEFWKKEVKPFRPKDYSDRAIRLKLEKYKWLNSVLSNIYEIKTPKLRVGHITQESWNNPLSSGCSNYCPSTHTITLDGKFSALTYLHEFGHARGFDEFKAVDWSVNLFRKTFPKSFAKLKAEGHAYFREN